MHYIRVDEAPEKLKTNEMVIHKPDFLEEIKAQKGKRGVNSTATIRNIRDTLMTITDKYDQTINPYHLKLQKFDNLMYDGDEGYAKIIGDVIRFNGLPLVDKAIEQQLKARSPMVDTVYYVSPDIEGSAAFISLGFSMKDGKKSTKKTAKTEDVV